ncbi:hypothetical protein ABIB30_003844 [Pedobacter sp. UYP1]
MILINLISLSVNCIYSSNDDLSLMIIIIFYVAVVSNKPLSILNEQLLDSPFTNNNYVYCI